MSYYYLIAGLPDLSFDQIVEEKAAQVIDFKEVVDLIQRNLEESDQQSFRYLLYPYDNRNLLNVLFAKYKDFSEMAFQNLGIYTQEEIREYHKGNSIFPAYMSAYLEAYEDQLISMTPREIEDKLWDMFYDEVAHQDNYINRYFHFERELRELIAASNLSYFDFLGQPGGRRDGERDQVRNRLSGSSALMKSHPYLETMVEQVSAGNPKALERFLNRIKWDYLDEEQGFFAKEQVFAYTLKLLIIYRWSQLSLSLGASRFSSLQEEIKSNVRSFKTPQV
ncbi:MAG: DUF2764 family protein [Cyclobacteriaceae bacterium]|nr:DUF2764 family protein [Cyclobacteriaceae bacterium HetDA_MAG_MS6]